MVKKKKKKEIMTNQQVFKHVSVCAGLEMSLTSTKYPVNSIDVSHTLPGHTLPAVLKVVLYSNNIWSVEDPWWPLSPMG